MNIVGVAGPAGAGKDAIAEILVNNFGFTRRAFADPLYEQVAEAFGVTVGFLRNRDTKESPMAEMSLSNCRDKFFVDIVRGEFPMTLMDTHNSPRRIMQLWGTEYRRLSSGNNNYWVDQMGEWIANSKASVVIPDVRFDNEANFIRNTCSGSVWHVERDVARVAAHASEAGVEFVDGTDARINNRGSLDDLVVKVCAVANAFNKKPGMKL